MASAWGTSRHPWLAGAGVFLLAALLGGGIGWAAGARTWWLYLGLVLAVLLGIGWVERLWAQRKVPRPPRARGRLKLIPGGKSGYDLEKDDPNHRQRWLM